MSVWLKTNVLRNLSNTGKYRSSSISSRWNIFTWRYLTYWTFCLVNIKYLLPMNVIVILDTLSSLYKNNGVFFSRSTNNIYLIISPKTITYEEIVMLLVGPLRVSEGVEASADTYWNITTRSFTRWHTAVTSKDCSIYGLQRPVRLFQGHYTIPRILRHIVWRLVGAGAFLFGSQPYQKYVVHH